MMTNLFIRVNEPAADNTLNRRHQRMKAQILSAIGFATSLYTPIFLGMFMAS